VSRSRRRAGKRWTVGAVALTPLQWGIDPTSAVASGPERAVASFLLVSGVAAAVRYWRPGLVERAVDAALDRPLATPLYGVAAAVFGWLAVAYVFGQALRVGGGVGRVAVFLGVWGALVVGAFGFVVVGTGVTTILTSRRSWGGPLVGAGVSALVLLVLPDRPGLVVWGIVAATGLGGSARRWLRASASVEQVTE